MIYKAKDSAATDSESRKKEDEKIVEIFLIKNRNGRKTNCENDPTRSKN